MMSPSSPDKVHVARRSAAVLAAAGLLFLLYGLIGPALEPFHVDHAWFTSFIYNYVAEGIERDTVFGAVPESGSYGGTQLFGKIFSTLGGLILAPAGWTPAAARALAAACFLLSLPLWYAAARLMGLGRAGSLLFVALLSIAKPSVYAASVLRPETFMLLLTAAVVFCALRGWQATAGFLSACALETHPIGVIAPLSQAALLFRGGARILPLAPQTARALAGLAAGGALYLALHAGALSQLPGMITGAGQGDFGKFFLLSYLRSGRYLHRYAELLVVVAAFWLYLRGGGPARHPGVAALFSAAALVSLLPLRGNPHYVVLVLPAALLVVACTAELRGRHVAVFLCACAYFAPLLLAGALRHGPTAAARDRHQRAVAAAVPRDGAPVIGSPEEWWVMKDRPYHVPMPGRSDLPAASWKTYYVVHSPRLFEEYRLLLPDTVRQELAVPARASVKSLRTELGGETLVYRVTRTGAERNPP